MARTKYLGFPIPAELQVKIDTLLHNMNNTDDKSKYALDVFSVVKELSDVGLAYFFTAPLKAAKIGMLKMKSIEMAISAGKSGIFAVAKGILKSMSDEQLNVVLELFEKSLTVHPDDEDEEAA